MGEKLKKERKTVNFQVLYMRTECMRASHIMYYILCYWRFIVLTLSFDYVRFACVFIFS